MAFYACKDNVVCPAFQSTYILDDAARMKKYSYFENDSTPKFALVSRKSKYGVNKKSSLFRKNYDLKTAPKINVLPPLPEDTSIFELEGEFLASDFVDTDSLGTDSVSTAPLFVSLEEDPGPKYKYRYKRTNPYNHDQEYYNKYYGQLLVDNRPPPISEEKLAEELQQLSESDTTTVEKRGRKNRKSNEEEEQDEPESIEPVIEEEVIDAEDTFGDDPIEEKEEDPQDDPEEQEDN